MIILAADRPYDAVMSFEPIISSIAEDPAEVLARLGAAVSYTHL